MTATATATATAPTDVPDVVVEIGTVLVATWGWEQTNVDFYEVVGVTAHTVLIRSIRSTERWTGWMRGVAVPVPGAYIGAPRRRRLDRAVPDPWFTICSWKFAKVWDGKPVRFSAYA